MKTKDIQSTKEVQQILKVLKNQNMTTKELSEKSNLAYGTLSRILNCKQPLMPNTREKIYKALGIGEKKIVIEVKHDLNGFIEFNGKITKLTTIQDYLNLEDEVLSQSEPTEVDAHGHVLMSDLLPLIPQVIEHAQTVDVDGLRKFLITETNKPLIVTGHGGQMSFCNYLSLLYGTQSAIGMAVTNYSMNSISDTALSNSKVLIATVGGTNIDVTYITKRLINVAPGSTACIAQRHKGNLVWKMIEKVNPSNCFDLGLKQFSELGFIDVLPIIHQYVIAYRAFTNDNDVLGKLSISTTPSDNFTYCLNDVDSSFTLPSLGSINHLVVLYGSWGEPIAADIESKLTESGLVNVQVSDYRNYCHGRFLFPSRHVKNDKKNGKYVKGDTAILLLGTPKEAEIIKKVRKLAIPKQMPILSITTDFDSPIASIDLLIKSTVLVSRIGETRGVNPYSPIHFGDIDKRAPKTIIDYKKEFDKFGSLGQKIVPTIDPKPQTYKTRKDKNAPYESIFATDVDAPTPFRNVIFGMDGTLLDTSPLMPLEHKMRGIRGKEKEELRKQMNALIPSCPKHEGMDDVFQFVRDNKLITSMVTGCAMKRLIAIDDYIHFPVKRENMIDRFYFADSAHGTLKPDPITVQQAMRLMNVTDAIVIGNKPEDIKVASKTNNLSVACHWCVDEDEWKKILKQNPTYIAETASDLIPLLRRDNNDSKVKMYTLPTKGIIGGICGDIIGVPYERVDGFKKTDFPLFGKNNKYSDDTVLMLAVSKWLMGEHTTEYLKNCLLEVGNAHIGCGYGKLFKQWLKADTHEPYGATTNGAAMRVGAVGYYAKSLEEALELAKMSAEVTHNSHEAIRGAQAVASAVFLTRNGNSKDEVKKYIAETFGYDLERDIEDIRKTYKFEATCDKSVPEAIICWLQSNTYEEAIRNAVGLGGDSDTMACIAGVISAATEGMEVPQEVANKCYTYIPNDLRMIYEQFEMTINK